jgi:hypothetical protein
VPLEDLAQVNDVASLITGETFEDTLVRPDGESMFIVATMYRTLPTQAVASRLKVSMERCILLDRDL